jgi:predicted amidohydrolase
MRPHLDEVGKMTPRRRFTVGLVQMRMSGSVEKNLEHAISMIGDAAKGGAKVVCLPELFATPYFPQYKGSKPSDIEGSDWVDTIPGSITRDLSSVAKENEVVLIGGSIYELDRDKLYNTSVVFDEDGKQLGIYRKTHIPHDENFYEQHYFERGDTGFQVFDTTWGRVSVLICYDQWFPEAARAVALQGAEIIFYPTAIGTAKGIRQKEGNWQQAWEGVMRGHAIANNIVVCGVNRCGREDRMNFWGGSFVCDAFGKILERAGRKEEVVLCKVDLDHGKEVREGWRFFYNRRPECYGALTDQGPR